MSDIVDLPDVRPPVAANEGHQRELPFMLSAATGQMESSIA